MHKGEFIGDHADKQNKRILILGESHHISSDQNSPNQTLGAEASYNTEDVVLEYLENYNNCTGSERKSSLRFFDNIVRAFGKNPEECRTDFWAHVYFGNYIDVLCGVGDSTAVKTLREPGMREKLNRKLFEFIDENKIDVVFCFSRRVYDKLPPLEKNLGDTEEKRDKSDSHRLDKCVYGKGQRDGISVSLSKPVVVYGLKHPSQGFSYSKYQDRIKKVVQEQGLPF